MKDRTCNNCKKTERTYLLHVGNNSDRLCDTCFNSKLKSYVSEGIKAFVSVLYQNLEEEHVIVIANQIFDPKDVAAELDEYKKMVPMFTYGILKYPSNIEYDGGINIVENAIVKGHVMYATSRGTGFPVTKVTGSEHNIVYGTYFEIPRHVVEFSYDLTEGYSPLNHPSMNMYNREMVEVTLPNGEKKDANMYIANNRGFKETMIPELQIMTGNYDDKYTHIGWRMDL